MCNARIVLGQVLPDTAIELLTVEVRHTPDPLELRIVVLRLEII